MENLNHFGTPGRGGTHHSPHFTDEEGEAQKGGGKRRNSPTDRLLCIECCEHIISGHSAGTIKALKLDLLSLNPSPTTWSWEVT